MRRIAALTAVVAVLGLAGCASTPAPITEESFLRQASSLKSWSTLSSDQIVKLGQGLCGALQKAESRDERSQVVEYYAAEMGDQAADHEQAAADAAVFAQLAVDRFCPDQTFD